MERRRVIVKHEHGTRLDCDLHVATCMFLSTKLSSCLNKYTPYSILYCTNASRSFPFPTVFHAMFFSIIAATRVRSVQLWIHFQIWYKGTKIDPLG